MIIDKWIHRIAGISFLLLLSVLDGRAQDDGWKLVWCDEFNQDGRLDTTVWNYEQGFKRNHEDQWYQAENAYCRNGKLIIEARREQAERKNPDYEAGSADWRKKREHIAYTSASVNTAGKYEFLYGRLEVRAKIPTAGGAWPAIWLLGSGMPWPSCGEIDVMEYYRIGGVPHILANACWGDSIPNHAVWNSQRIPFTHFTGHDAKWADKFHTWRMDWDESSIRFYLDDELLNEISLGTTVNGSIGLGTNPFRKPQYVLLNLALGGDNGGEIADEAFPMKYEIDYVRVYQKAPSDRQYWCNLLYRIAEPVLSNMSEGKLHQNMQLELSPRWDGRNKEVAYMECFGRTMAGVAPWLSLPDDDTPEGQMRKQLRTWALKSYAHAVNPESPDYLGWNKHGQALVDAAYIAESFLRAPSLWHALDTLTRQRYIKEFAGLRRYTPVYSNWVMFVSLIETFLSTVSEDYDAYRIHIGLRKINEWYVGDGWYSDGPGFAFDYYNSFVIQPMYVEALQVLHRQKRGVRVSAEELARAEKRLQRYGTILERMISPEGAFPVFGRSITYRLGALQALAMLAWQEKLPEGLSEGQVRSALTAVMKRMYATDANFNEKGFLTLGFTASQTDIADVYTNNGSLYMTTLAFMPLGLPADHPFWTSPAENWTSKKAWEGEDFPKDHAYYE